MSVVLWISYSSPFLKSPCIHDVFTRRRMPFSYPTSWIQPVCGWSTCECLAVFPRPKGRKNFISFFDYLVALVMNCDIPDYS
jgi:hypothetical protein